MNEEIGCKINIGVTHTQVVYCGDVYEGKKRLCKDCIKLR